MKCVIQCKWKCYLSEAKKSMFRKPEGTKFQKFIFYYTWPIKMILRCTIPNARLYPKIFPLTFILCITWIGINAYIVSWMISILGKWSGVPLIQCLCFLFPTKKAYTIYEKTANFLVTFCTRTAQFLDWLIWTPSDSYSRNFWNKWSDFSHKLRS